jgi:hypothetical protein
MDRRHLEFHSWLQEGDFGVSALLRRDICRLKEVVGYKYAANAVVFHPKKDWTHVIKVDYAIAWKLMENRITLFQRDFQERK